MKKAKMRKPKPPVESEASIQRRIVDYLEAHGWFIFQNRSDGLGGKIAAFATTKQSGSPDLFAWRDSQRYDNWILDRHPELIKEMPPQPRHFAVEVKRPGGKCSDAQLAWAGRFCSTGHKLVVATSHEEVETFLRSQGWL